MTKENKSQLTDCFNISTRSLYYKPKQEAKDWKTKQMIEGALRTHSSYGHKRLAQYLKINKKRVLRVMKKYGIKPYRRTVRPQKRSKNKGSIISNLLLTETPMYPNHIWATDFTYLKFQGHWLYISTVIDLYTREVIGLSILKTHNTQLVLNTLTDALLHHSKPKIIHSDQGSEYNSKDFISFCSNLKINQSMSHPGCPWENGYQESFYKGFKVELGDPNRFETLGELISEIYLQIHYYNHSRIHTSLKMSPRQFAIKLLVG
jgi:transposase InsO family protein